MKSKTRKRSMIKYRKSSLVVKKNVNRKRSKSLKKSKIRRRRILKGGMDEPLPQRSKSRKRNRGEEKNEEEKFKRQKLFDEAETRREEERIKRSEKNKKDIEFAKMINELSELNFDTNDVKKIISKMEEL